MDVQVSISSQVLFGSILLFGTVRHFAENLLLVQIVAGYHCKFHQKSDMQLKHCLTMRDEQCEHHCHKLKHMRQNQRVDINHNVFRKK